jgi:hypothetical protein
MMLPKEVEEYNNNNNFKDLDDPYSYILKETPSPPR